MIKADVLITNIEWIKYIDNPKLYIAKKLKRFEKKISLFKNNDLTFSIKLSGDIEVKKLNKKFRKKTKSTDILSFPSCEKKILKKTLVENKKFYLGDVIINLSQNIQQSKKSNFNFAFDHMNPVSPSVIRIRPVCSIVYPITGLNYLCSCGQTQSILAKVIINEK